MLPNFLVIGVAKAGTTALHWYLAEHPSIFMSRAKDPSYFAYGLDERGELLWGNPEIHEFPVKSQREYEEIFERAQNAPAIGEASTMYFECPQAAGRIRSLIPEARIVCCLRHPVDRAYSDYQMYLRSVGRRLDAGRDLSATSAWVRRDSHWMQISQYHGHLKRYYDVFAREQIHILLFEDLRKNPLGLLQDLYRFLGVEPGFVPDLETPHNVGGMPVNPLLEGVLTSQLIRTVVKPWVPRQAANWVRRLRTRNMRPAPPLPLELRRQLTDSFREDITQTSALIGRDLTHWL